GTGNVPVVALSVRRQHESAFPRAHQHPYAAHPALLPDGSITDFVRALSIVDPRGPRSRASAQIVSFSGTKPVKGSALDISTESLPGLTQCVFDMLREHYQFSRRFSIF